MKRSLLSMAVAGASLSLISSVAFAGGMDRSGQDTSIITEDGNVVEILSVNVKPKVSGTYAATLGGGATGDVTPDYSMTSIALKMDITDNIAIAVISDEPFGSELNWAAGVFSGTTATITSSATTLIGSYALEGGMSVFGGIRDQSADVAATVELPNPLSYSFAKASTSATGYLVGASFSKPEIALKVSLTYNAKVKHSIAVNENVNGTTTAATVGTLNWANTASFYLPSSYNLDFQTGIAEDTLLFGSIRRVNWTETDVKPDGYAYATSKSLLSYDNDTTTYNIGLGRKFSDNWSGAVTYGYEAAQSGKGSPTSPTNGNSKYGVGVTYNTEQLSTTLAVQHVEIGDQIANIGSHDSPMTGNTGLVTALKISAKF